MDTYKKGDYIAVMTNQPDIPLLARLIHFHVIQWEYTNQQFFFGWVYFLQKNSGKVADSKNSPYLCSHDYL